MARYERNRGMLFASWDGKNISSSAEPDYITSTATLSVGCYINTFANKVNNSGEYQFFYKGNNLWEYNDTDVKLSDYGITVSVTSGSLSVGDMINIVFTKGGSGWDVLGYDNDSLTKDLNPEVEKYKNILGKSFIRHNGYEAEITIDPYYVDPSRKMYKQLLHNAIEENNGEDQLKGKIAEAFFTVANKQLGKMKGFCYVRDAWFIPQSTGGDTSAYGIPIAIIPIGESTHCNIVYDMITHEATITNAT